MKKSLTVLSFLIVSALLVACSNNNPPGTDLSKLQLWGEEMRATSDIIKPADFDSSDWRYHAKFVDNKKIVRTILDAVMSGKRKAYAEILDEKSEISIEDIKAMMNKTDTVMKDDPNSPGNLIAVVQDNSINE